MVSEHGQQQRQPATAGAIPALDGRIDARFRSLTEAGNRAFAEGDDGLARDRYLDALDEAERLFARAAQGGDSAAILFAPMALTIACHNIAELKSQDGAASEARAVSLSAAERLIAAAASPARPIALRINCARHLRHALWFLGELGGDQAETQALATRAAQVSAEVTRIARLCLDSQGGGARSARSALS